MNLIGEIVEKEIETPSEFTANVETSGFPAADLLKKKRALRFKNAQNPVRSTESTAKDSPSASSKAQENALEAQKIHQENLNRLANMSEAEILQEQQELLSGLDPKLVKSLTNRSKARSKVEHSGHNHAEGYNGWIGGAKEGVQADFGHLDDEDVDRALGISKKSVSFAPTVEYEDLDDTQRQNMSSWEDVDDVRELTVNANAVSLEDEAPADYQLTNDDEEPEDSVHFPKPSTKLDEDLDLNDPSFFDKLHEKYYPDLPKETSKLSWMTTPVPHVLHTTYESVSDIRFDFQGNIVELPDTEEAIDKIPTYLGLHHHSDAPNLAGYTLPELAHLSRSVVPGQRCISIMTLGRILHKLGKHKYNVAESGSSEVNQQFEEMVWSVIEQHRILDTLTEAADESRTKNLSVRNYALEALWLWKQGGGRPDRQNLQDYIS